MSSVNNNFFDPNSCFTTEGFTSLDPNPALKVSLYTLLKPTTPASVQTSFKAKGDRFGNGVFSTVKEQQANLGSLKAANVAQTNSNIWKGGAAGSAAAESTKAAVEQENIKRNKKLEMTWNIRCLDEDIEKEWSLNPELIGQLDEPLFTPFTFSQTETKVLNFTKYNIDFINPMSFSINGHKAHYISKHKLLGEYRYDCIYDYTSRSMIIFEGEDGLTIRYLNKGSDKWISHVFDPESGENLTASDAGTSCRDC